MHIAPGPVFLSGNLENQADRFLRFNVVLGNHFKAGLAGEIRENFFGELPVLSAIENDTRLAATASDKTNDHKK